FDLHPELIGTLEQAGKTAQLQALESLLPVAGATSFIRQQSPQGLGHAVWCAREVIGDEPFALLLPDMVSFGGRGCLAEIADLYA
ncbi:MAG: UTP--glucose-1-phosphate uridylyltransferase, partial [Mesorhizobium sp.]